MLGSISRVLLGVLDNYSCIFYNILPYLGTSKPDPGRYPPNIGKPKG